jgi:hypothetical protein
MMKADPIAESELAADVRSAAAALNEAMSRAASWGLTCDVDLQDINVYGETGRRPLVDVKISRAL